MTKQVGSSALLETMINYGVKYVFGIPGAKIDKMFEELAHSKDPRKPRLIICRHEQNAAFMAAAIGRLTGKPGVVLVTSGPGVANLATGLVTATAEGDPVIALGGQVPRDDLARLTHQSISNQAILAPTTKFSTEVENPNNLSEAFANAYQAAVDSKRGAVFISIPQDVINGAVTRKPMRENQLVEQGVPAEQQLRNFSSLIKEAHLPVILAGMRASDQRNTRALRNFLKWVPIPVVETFQGAGIISHDLIDLYYGRVGLFHNQTGDMLLKKADLVITIGYDPIEYEARNWNVNPDSVVINLDSVAPELTVDYQPEIILQGDIASTINELSKLFTEPHEMKESTKNELKKIKAKFDSKDVPPVEKDPNLVHPLAVVKELQNHVTDDMIETVDVGSHYIWMARHFRSYEPRHLLFSNGMQTLGVALPWAISASLLNPGKKIVSNSGDGGFLFSGQELETAVRLHANIVQLIWDDGHYDMVRFQELAKYGKDAGVDFGPVDFVKYAESFGAKGLRVDKDHSLKSVMDKAFATDGPVVVEIPVDYSHNSELNENMLSENFY